MKTAWTQDAWEEYLHWQEEDKKILASINVLMEDIKGNPFKGLGKPELCRYRVADPRLCRTRDIRDDARQKCGVTTSPVVHA